MKNLIKIHRNLTPTALSAADLRSARCAKDAGYAEHADVLISIR